MAKFDAHLKCSFCGKSQDQVRKLIAGPGVYICDECIDLCNEILDEELLDNQANTDNSPQIKKAGGVKVPSFTRIAYKYQFVITFLKKKYRLSFFDNFIN